MKTVLLLAYTNLNFGDDMFIKTITRCMQDVKFVIEAPSNYVDIFADCSNLQVKTEDICTKAIDKVDRAISKLFKLESRLLRHLKLKKFDAVVYVIGGLFDDDDIWEEQVKNCGIRKYKDSLWKHSFYEDVPFYLIGCNMTRIRSEKYIESMKYVFSGLSDICFRDLYSYKWFSELPNTRYAPDIVFNYPIHSLNSDESILISVWGVLLHCDKMPQWKWAENLWDTYENFMFQIIHYFKRKNKKVILLALCENEGDLDACNILAAKFDYDVDIKCYKGNLEETIQLFEKAQFVIGTRFHSIVMALSASIPVYPIVYESKTAQLLNDCSYKGEYSDIKNIEENEIHKVINSFDIRYTVDISNIKKEARKQFQKLNEFLGREDI